MSELHHLLTFPTRPLVEDEYVSKLTHFLSSGVPATYTLEQVKAFEDGIEDEEDDPECSNTTPLHTLCRSVPLELSEEEVKVVLKMMDVLFEYGAGWNFIDYEDKTIGDLLEERGYGIGTVLYTRVVEAGVSAELLLRKVNDNVEFIDAPDAIEDAAEDATEDTTEDTTKDATADVQPDPADHPETYLNTKLEYTDTSLVTKEQRDGVMMDWETAIMKLAADTITSTTSPNQNCNVLNIGFGMGIIDTFIQHNIADQPSTKHYICEAHPDVLAKMKKDGWYQKQNVVILEGRWQENLDTLLDQGEVYFDGIYYDTFSEQYQDILQLTDLVLGLLKPNGVFSFFNGLGADRPLCYEVYKQVLAIDMTNCGLNCHYSTVPLANKNHPPSTKEPDWDKVKRSYYNCNRYHHPRITFV